MRDVKKLKTFISMAQGQQQESTGLQQVTYAVHTVKNIQVPIHRVPSDVHTACGTHFSLYLQGVDALLCLNLR